MRRDFSLALGILVVTAVCSAAFTQLSTTPRSNDDLAAIQRLHEEDVKATLSGKADDLAKTWCEDAVRMEPGGPAEIGLANIYGEDKREEQSGAGALTLSYVPDIKDLQIKDGWAFEWGYFESSYKPSAHAEPVTLRGKLLRVLKRQPDGSWKFARVMWNTAK